MARIQVLELPMVHQGDQTETPFVLVIDGLTSEEADQLVNYERLDVFSKACGARACGVFPFSVSVD